MSVLRSCACDLDCEETLDLICRDCGEMWGEKKCTDPYDLRCMTCGGREIEEMTLPIAAE